MSASAPAVSSILSGRYAIFGEIASGGMASVQYGRLLGPVGFARPVAIKRLHPHIAREPGLLSMFIDEAHICARVSHANVVPTLDVIEAPGELALVMEYVHGATLETLLDLAVARAEPVPLGVAAALLLGVLHGLSAAHAARNDAGELLGIVHRDVSPQNILVGVDGVPRLLDFGIAKARGRLRTTPSGEIKGKLLYMAPEQLRHAELDRRVDVYGAAAVLWEVLAGRTLFEAPNESAIVHRVLYDVVPPPSKYRPEVSPALDAVVLRGLAREPEARFDSAEALIAALEGELRAASQSEVSAWLHGLAGDQLKARAEFLKELQRAAETGSSAQAVRHMQDSQPLRTLESAGGRAAAWQSTRGDYSVVRPRKHRLLLWGLAALGLVLALVWLWPAAQAPRASTAMPAAPAKQPPAEQPLPAPEPASSGAAPLGDAAAAQPSDPARLDAPRRAAGAARAPANKPRSTRDCREPYVIDALGVKRWKRECL
jgi:serine/threonine protein kinase